MTFEELHKKHMLLVDSINAKDRHSAESHALVVMKREAWLEGLTDAGLNCVGQLLMWADMEMADRGIEVPMVGGVILP